MEGSRGIQRKGPTHGVEGRGGLDGALGWVCGPGARPVPRQFPIGIPAFRGRGPRHDVNEARESSSARVKRKPAAEEAEGR